MAYDNTNSGALFKNDRKSKQTDRDYNGTCEVTCPDCGVITEHWISSWINTAKTTGKKYMSLKFQPKEDQVPKPPTDYAKDRSVGGKDEGDGDDGFDDIPF